MPRAISSVGRACPLHGQGRRFEPVIAYVFFGADYVYTKTNNAVTFTDLRSVRIGTPNPSEAVNVPVSL